MILKFKVRKEWDIKHTKLSFCWYSSRSAFRVPKGHIPNKSQIWVDSASFPIQSRVHISWSQQPCALKKLLVPRSPDPQTCDPLMFWKGPGDRMQEYFQHSSVWSVALWEDSCHITSKFFSKIYYRFLQPLWFYVSLCNLILAYRRHKVKLYSSEISRQFAEIWGAVTLGIEP